MQFKKCYVIIPMLVIVLILLACSKKDAEVVVNDSVKVDSESTKDGLSNSYFSADLENLDTASATDKIKFVDKNHKVFWNAVKYNYIDDEYHLNENRIFVFGDYLTGAATFSSASHSGVLTSKIIMDKEAK